MRSAILWWEKLSFLLGLMKGNKTSFVLNIHSETAYGALVHRECQRSKRSGHLCRILLIYRTNAQGLVVPLGPELIYKTTSVLSSNCRDTDYIGWHRHGIILGLLVTTLKPDFVNNACDKLKTRLVERLCGVMAFTDDQSLQIRVLQPGELTIFNASDNPASSTVFKN